MLQKHNPQLQIAKETSFIIQIAKNSQPSEIVSRQKGMYVVFHDHEAAFNL